MTLQQKARESKNCPVCGEPKNNGIVCWGICWRYLKTSEMETEEWIKKNANPKWLKSNIIIK